ncbi:MAG TPA: CUAEP/CCAEP-tail radical SAM protein, partial [Vicinamibacterales bacterium]|nr:CUAEP/CCAEP-tail radical SAM protein [Vicinamibacterales bacterium]
MRVLLISTYDLGRQPLGLASPAAWLRNEGIQADCVDTSRDTLTDHQIGEAGLIAFYLPMHTATRLASPLIARASRVNPSARLAAYGLYAPLNAAWLGEHGVTVLGPDAEADLVNLARGSEPRAERPEPRATSRARFIQPDRSTLLPLSRYAALQMPDGTRRVAGSTEATRGCKHLCRHCPIVPVYGGTFRAIPIDVVMSDVRAQVAAGAQHISFADPDFFNGPTHARRLVEAVAKEFPGLTYDVTIKIEHILRHAEMLGLLRETGCLMITSAVESVDDDVLLKLQKGHTRSDFIAAVGACRQAGVSLAPTFVPFTPWTTMDGYLDLLEQIRALELTESVAPIQLAIRLLVTAESKLLELPDVLSLVDPFDPQSLTYPWRHPDPRVDDLQRAVMQVVAAAASGSRSEVFDRLWSVAKGVRPLDMDRLKGSDPFRCSQPYMTEGWYCCAEPG